MLNGVKFLVRIPFHETCLVSDLEGNSTSHEGSEQIVLDIEALEDVTNNNVHRSHGKTSNKSILHLSLERIKRFRSRRPS